MLDFLYLENMSSEHLSGLSSGNSRRELRGDCMFAASAIVDVMDHQIG